MTLQRQDRGIVRSYMHARDTSTTHDGSKCSLQRALLMQAITRVYLLNVIVTTMQCGSAINGAFLLDDHARTEQLYNIGHPQHIRHISYAPMVASI